MRKYLKINADKTRLIEALTQIEQWPQWWPGFIRGNVLEERASGFVAQVAIDMKVGGKMTLDVDFSQGDVVVFRQLQGWFKEYSNIWTLRTDPQTPGTTVKVEITVAAGALVSKRMLHDKVGQALLKTETSLNKYLLATAPTPVHTGHTFSDDTLTPATATAPAEVLAKPADGQRPVHVFQTAKGLEMWVAGRRYVLKYAGWSKEEIDLSAWL